MNILNSSTINPFTYKSPGPGINNILAKYLPGVPTSTPSSPLYSNAKFVADSKAKATLSDQLFDFMDESINSISTSANAQIEQAKLTNAFNAEQAALNRDFNSAEAEKARQFNAQQAALNRSFQLNSALQAMDFEANEALKLRQWQEVQNQKAMDYNTEMSNTAYQRAVKDLQAAGLNPILAYSQGGASTPSGVTSSGASASGKSVSGSAASGSAASGSAATGVMANVRGEFQDMLELFSGVINTAERAFDSVVGFFNGWKKK